MKKYVIFLPFLFLAILLFRADQSFTQDLGRHLTLGQLISECFCVPKTNLFSYTAPDFSFVNHHWLPEVVFYFLVKITGLYSLLWFKIGMIMSAFALSFYTALKKDWLLTSAVAVPFIFILSERFDVRPEIFSFVFLAATVFLLDRYLSTRQLKMLLPIPFIQLLWVNSHIYFFLGSVLFTFFLIHLTWRKQVTKEVFIIGALSVVVMLANPHGISGVLYPLRVFGNYGYTIVENQNIFFLNGFFFNPRILVFELTALSVGVLAFFRLRKQHLFDFLCMTFGVIAGGIMIRNFPIFVFLAFPGTVAALLTVLQTQKSSIQKQICSLFAVSMLLFACGVSLNFLRSPNFGLQYIYGAEKAAEFFKTNQLPGKIFNNFDIGSYLIYSLYPEQKVFVDGRPEAYPVAFFNEYKQMQTDPKLFQSQVIRYDINTVFFAHTDITPWAQEFLRTITHNADWVPIYLDERIVIFVRDSPENSDLIRKFKLQLPEA